MRWRCAARRPGTGGLEERARMIVADIPIARPVDVRPRHDAPFGLDRFAVSIGGQTVGHLLGQIENEGDLRASPDCDLAVRVPASRIGSLNRWSRFALLQ